MANWLSSRLKAAEQLLQQIDQQAAATLHKEKDKDGQSSSGLIEEKPPERRSQSLRKEKESYGSPSTSDQASQSSRGRGKLFDRPVQSSKPGAGRKTAGEERPQRTPGQKSSKASSSSSSSQGMVASEGRDDWAELLGSTDFVGSTPISRSGSSRSGDLDSYSPALKSNRTKTPVSGKSTGGGLTHSSRTSSNGDLFSITPSKPNAQQLTPAKNSSKILRVSSYTAVEKANNAGRDDPENPIGRSLHDKGVEKDLKTSTAALSVGNEDVQFAGEILLTNGDDLKKEVECKEQVSENNAEIEGVRIDAPSGKRDDAMSAVSETSEIKELRQIDSEISEADGSGVEQRVPPNEDTSSSILDEADGPPASAEVASEGIVNRGEVELVEDEYATNNGLGGSAGEEHENGLSAVELAARLQATGDSLRQDDGGNESQEEEEEEDEEEEDGGEEEEEEGKLSVHSLSLSEEESSDSGTDGDSDSDDSEYEEKRRLKRLALRRKLAKRRAMEARAAAEEAAKVAIKEREDLVERMQREKDSLEALLAEGEEQHVKMAAELRESMMEVMQLLEQEKQMHNNTRRQGLELEVKLEAENAELAKSLAASQWDLEEITSQVSKARALVEAKVDACSDLQREAALLRIRLSRPNRSQRAIDDAFEAESMEEEKSSMVAKIEQLQQQAEDLQDSLKRLLDRQVAPSSIQLELESQLAQITDSLIHKQAQVEELSTEKATLVFRVEAVSNTLREEKLALVSRSAKRNPNKGAWSDWSYFDEDLEYGFGKTYSAKDKGWDTDDGRYENVTEASHLQPFLRLVRQVDGLVMGAALVLRKNGMARAFAGLYLLALHWWVVFILFSHPAAPSDVISGTRDPVFSTLGDVHSSLNHSTGTFL